MHGGSSMESGFRPWSLPDPKKIRTLPRSPAADYQVMFLSSPFRSNHVAKIDSSLGMMSQPMCERYDHHRYDDTNSMEWLLEPCFLNFRATPEENDCLLTYCNRTTCMADLLWNREQTGSSDPKSGPYHWVTRLQLSGGSVLSVLSVNPCVKDRFITRYDEVTLWVVERTLFLNFRATPEGRRLSPYILRATGPHAWRIFCGIGFRPWSLPVQKPGPYH
ncbi:hypothetical protein AVEN_50661-1 [Araneus ventricosus]|uniref:Uncharacterized protein n=1 Tax=Araneus ventricosus TaxID=182803 RepID=A0A4Y2JKQ5_ARAVE|nr:hypothetical protein AVEN_50661-1 [Araneus ventricosus]